MRGSALFLALFAVKCLAQDTMDLGTFLFINFYLSCQALIFFCVDFFFVKKDEEIDPESHSLSPSPPYPSLFTIQDGL